MVQENNRRQREKQRHRNEILDAAEKVFADNGFHRSTMEQVAQVAEFSVGTLYNFFSGKDQLYRELIEQRFRQLYVEISKSMDEANDPASVIRTYIESKIDLCIKYIDFARLYTRERLSDRFTDNELWWKVVAPIYDNVLLRLQEAFEQGGSQGCFRTDISASDMVVALEGLTDSFMYDWLMGMEKYAYKDKLELIVRMFFEGVRPK